MTVNKTTTRNTNPTIGRPLSRHQKSRCVGEWQLQSEIQHHFTDEPGHVVTNEHQHGQG